MDKYPGERKKLIEVMKAELEARRREAVARQKLWGYMIEVLDKKRNDLRFQQQLINSVIRKYGVPKKEIAEVFAEAMKKVVKKKR